MIPSNVLAILPTKYNKLLSKALPKGMKVKVADDTVNGITRYHIAGHCDDVLMKLAKAMNFPRGFTIAVHDSGSRIDAVGFFPKFDNDKSASNVSSSDADEIKHGGSATVTLKFSGHLLKILVLKKSDETLGVFLETKNTSAHEFVDKARDVVTKFMTPELMEHMYSTGIALIGEMIASHDAVHGAIPLQDAFVLTCVSQSSLGTDSSNVVNYFDHSDLLALAVRFGIPVAPFWTVRGDGVDALLKTLNETRDLCTYSDVSRILGNPTICGSIDHAAVLGERLEGLVIFGARKTIKFKFGRYTSVTFGLRTAIKNRVFYAIPETFVKFVEGYIKQWIRTDQGRDYFRSWFVAARYEFLARPENYADPSGHIRLADYVTDNLDVCLSKSVELPVAHLTLIVIVGPIGFGKSTHGTEISKLLGGIPHIDGDGHGLSKLGKDRNDATKGLVLSALRQTGAALVSTGGGAIQGIDDSVSIAFPGAKLQIVTFVVGSDCKFVDKSFDFKNLYDTSIDLTAEILNERKSRIPEVWSPDVPLDKIHAASRNNAKFAQMWVDRSEEDLASKISLWEAPPSRMNVRQARAGVCVKPTGVGGHFTLRYSTEPFDASEVEPLDITTIDATLYVFKSGDSTIRVVIPDEHPCIPNHFHVTVDPGKHKPGQMKQVTLNVRNSLTSFTLDGREYSNPTKNAVKIEVVIPLFFVA